MTSLLSGYLDRTGALVIPLSLRDAQAFHGQLALAKPFGGWRYGIIGPDGAWVVPPDLAGYTDWSDGVIAFNLGGEHDADGNLVGGAWGLAGDGRVLVPPSLDDTGLFCQGMMPFQKGGRWGYLDRTGRVVIPPRFDEADDFSKDGVAVAREGDRDGYLKADGTWRLPPRFDELGPTSEGRGRARLGDHWHVIDLDGNVLSEAFDDVLPFHGGLARVVRDERIAYVGLDGRLLADEWFDEGYPYDGMAPVRRDEEWFLLDRRGGLHGPYSRAMSPTDGLARFVVDGDDGEGGVGFLAVDGSVRVPPRYTSALGFRDGMASVARDGKWTWIDTTGAELHEPYWHHTGSFAEGLATVRYGARAGVVDRTGRVVIPLEYDLIEPFSSGRAACKRIQWRQVVAPPASWHVVPEGGLAHPGFAGAGADDELRVSIGFTHNVTGDDSLRMQQIVAMWREIADAHARGDAVSDDWIADYAVSLRFGDVPYPVELAAVLLEELRAVGTPIQDVALHRLHATDDPALQFVTGWAATPDPRDPGGSAFFSDFEAYARQAFTGDPPPASESPQHLLAGRWNPRAESVAYAERVFTLYHPALRICYGCTQDGFVEDDAAATARAAQVADAVTRALAERFDRARVWYFPKNRDPGVPYPFRRSGDPGVEPIDLELDGRTRRGYVFALDSGPLLHDLGPGQFRYRENELMDALAAAVAAAGLSPVVMWQRFGDPLPAPSYPGWAHPMQPTVYVLNLWEN